MPDKEQSPSVTELCERLRRTVPVEGRPLKSDAERPLNPDGPEAAARIEALHAEREKLAYHAEQLATYIAQPTISEKHLASARWHNDKIRAALRNREADEDRAG